MECDISIFSAIASIHLRFSSHTKLYQYRRLETPLAWWHNTTNFHYDNEIRDFQFAHVHFQFLTLHSCMWLLRCMDFFFIFSSFFFLPPLFHSFVLASAVSYPLCVCTAWPHSIKFELVALLTNFFAVGLYGFCPLHLFHRLTPTINSKQRYWFSSESFFLFFFFFMEFIGK